VPQPVLAALVICIALSVINRHHIRISLAATPEDAAVLVTTFVASLLLPLNVAIFLGVGISIMLYLRNAARPHLVEYEFSDEGELVEADRGTRDIPAISIVHVEGDLFFGAADIFQDGVRRLAADPNIRVFILRMKNARHLDATTVMALDQLHDYLKSENRHLLISGVHGDVALVLKRSGLAARIGLENMFPAEENPTLATKKALQRAQQLLPNQKPAVRIFYSKPQKGST
jgi:SulP family sulfate permease